MNSDISLPSEIMTQADVREMLDISRATLHRMEKKGEILAYKFGGKKYYKRSEIMAGITANPIQVPALQEPTDDVQQAA